MDSCTTRLLLQHGGFKDQDVTKGGAHQRMIKGMVSQETRNQSHLGTEPLCPVALYCLGCCRGATAISQTSGRAQPSLLQDGQLYSTKPTRKDTVGTSAHRPGTQPGSGCPFPSGVFLLVFLQVIQIAVCKSTKMRKDREGGPRRTFFSPEKSHLSFTNEEVVLIVVVPGTCFQ